MIFGTTTSINGRYITMSMSSVVNLRLVEDDHELNVKNVKWLSAYKTKMFVKLFMLNN